MRKMQLNMPPKVKGQVRVQVKLRPKFIAVGEANKM